MTFISLNSLDKRYLGTEVSLSHKENITLGKDSYGSVNEKGICSYKRDPNLSFTEAEIKSFYNCLNQNNPIIEMNLLKCRMKEEYAEFVFWCFDRGFMQWNLVSAASQEEAKKMIWNLVDQWIDMGGQEIQEVTKNGESLLHFLVGSKAPLELIDRAITSGVAVDALMEDREGMKKTPLHLAIEQNQEEIFYYLIKQISSLKLEVSPSIQTYISTAIHSQNPFLFLDALIKKGIDVNEGGYIFPYNKEQFFIKSSGVALTEAIITNRLGIARLLLEAGANPVIKIYKAPIENEEIHADSLLFCIAKYGTYFQFQFLIDLLQIQEQIIENTAQMIDRETGKTLFHYLLLRKKKHVGYDGWTLPNVRIMMAQLLDLYTLKVKSKKIRKMNEKGGSQEVNVWDIMDNEGETPFLYAMKNRMISIAHLLLNYGVNLDIKLATGKGILHILIEHLMICKTRRMGREGIKSDLSNIEKELWEFFGILLHHKKKYNNLDIDAVTNLCLQTPLLFAIELYPEVVIQLIEAGASLEIRDRWEGGPYENILKRLLLRINYLVFLAQFNNKNDPSVFADRECDLLCLNLHYLYFAGNQRNGFDKLFTEDSLKVTIDRFKEIKNKLPPQFFQNRFRTLIQDFHIYPHLLFDCIRYDPFVLDCIYEIDTMHIDKAEKFKIAQPDSKIEGDINELLFLFDQNHERFGFEDWQKPIALKDDTGKVLTVQELRQGLEKLIDISLNRRAIIGMPKENTEEFFLFHQKLNCLLQNILLLLKKSDRENQKSCLYEMGWQAFYCGTRLIAVADDIFQMLKGRNFSTNGLAYQIYSFFTDLRSNILRILAQNNNFQITDVHFLNYLKSLIGEKIGLGTQSSYSGDPYFLDESNYAESKKQEYLSAFFKHYNPSFLFEQLDWKINREKQISSELLIDWIKDRLIPNDWKREEFEYITDEIKGKEIQEVEKIFQRHGFSIQKEIRKNSKGEEYLHLLQTPNQAMEEARKYDYLENVVFDYEGHFSKKIILDLLFDLRVIRLREQKRVYYF